MEITGGEIPLIVEALERRTIYLRGSGTKRPFLAIAGRLLVIVGLASTS